MSKELGSNPGLKYFVALAAMRDTIAGSPLFSKGNEKKSTGLSVK
jgi:hypothetical protein